MVTNLEKNLFIKNFELYPFEQSYISKFVYAFFLITFWWFFVDVYLLLTFIQDKIEFNLIIQQYSSFFEDTETCDDKGEKVFQIFFYKFWNFFAIFLKLNIGKFPMFCIAFAYMNKFSD